MKKIHIVLLIFSITLLSVFLINACENTAAPLESPTNQNAEIDLDNMADMEEVLRTLAKALPDGMTDEELSKVLYDEVNKNVEDEAYALWSEIADKSTPSGKTLRKVLDTELINSLGKVSDIAITSETFDKNNRLQVYIFNFDKWNGKDKLQVAYTPLTINDVDVTELEVFKPNGKSYIMDVSDKMWEPNFPIAIVGLNESASFDDEYDNQFGISKISETMSSNIYWTWIEVRKPRNLEPWYKGKANMRLQRVPNQLNNSSMNVKNPSGQTCSTKKTDNSPVMLIDYGSSTTIRVFEFDFGGWPDWVIESADLTVYPGGSYSLSVTDTGKWYKCGSNVRCDYRFALE